MYIGQKYFYSKTFTFVFKRNSMVDIIFKNFILFQTHLPGYIQKANELKSKGVAEIFCISVNDPFVMAAWGKEHGAEGKVRLYFIYCIYFVCNIIFISKFYTFSYRYVCWQIQQLNLQMRWNWQQIYQYWVEEEVNDILCSLKMEQLRS